MTHAFYANMGGFVLKRRNSVGGATCHERPRTAPPRLPSDGPTTPPTRHYNCDHIGQSARLIWYQFTNAELDFDLPIAVNSAQLCMLVSTKRIEFAPISKEEIKDKSKEDGVVKLLALLQVLWLLIQLIDRKVTGIPSTQLEITVVGFASSTFITYLFWLRKPKDINVATEVFITDDLTERDKRRLLDLNYFGFFENALWNKFVHKPALTVPNDMTYIESIMPSRGRSNWTMNFMDAGFILGGVVLGACHCIAWDFKFPTPIEQTLWRVASSFTTVAMPAYYLIWYILCKIPSLEWLTVALTSVTFTLYTLCRLYIMVEAFRSLFYLPPAAFMATWSLAIPHAG